MAKVKELGVNTIGANAAAGYREDTEGCAPDTCNCSRGETASYQGFGLEATEQLKQQLDREIS